MAERLYFRSRNHELERHINEAEQLMALAVREEAAILEMVEKVIAK